MTAESDLVDVQGARPVGDVRSIGRTQSLVLRPGQAAYGFRYRARQPDRLRGPLSNLAAGGADRWTLPRDPHPHSASTGLGPGPARCHRSHGPARQVRPDSVTFQRSSACLTAPMAKRPPWGIGRVMDAVAILVFGGATAIWAWRRRR